VNACLAVYAVVASQALGDVAFTSAQAMDLVDTLEGIGSVDEVAIDDKYSVGWGPEGK
jgi:hypothetical protein